VSTFLVGGVREGDACRVGSLWVGDFDNLDGLDPSLCAPPKVCRGDDDRDKCVDIVETESEETEAERILLDAPLASGSSLCLSRFRPLSCSAFASCSSATPFLQYVLVYIAI